MDKNIATLKLFNGIIVEKKLSYFFDNYSLGMTVPNGYILDASIPLSFIPLVEKNIIFSKENANASFHKSWAIVKESSLEDLMIDQIVHYLTTYGLEALGFYNDRYVYVPHEKLEIPEIKFNVPLLFVRGFTRDEILDKIISLGSGIALSQETILYILEILKDEKYDSSLLFGKITNRELLTSLYDMYNTYPSDPVEYLRFVVYKLTGETLLIKNDALIEKIKESSTLILDKAIQQAPKNLASIFFRYKPLFLAMKSISRNKTFFNHLRKMANKQHVPLNPDYLNSVTSQILNNEFDLDVFLNKVSQYSVFRKIRLLYALNFRLSNSKSIVYRVRNGRSWATSFDKYYDPDVIRVAIDIVRQSIVDDIAKNAKGKNYFIPYGIHYALPSTEKQFVGNVPSNSYVEIANGKSMVVGVHWFNEVDNEYGKNKLERVDLDLSMFDVIQKFGWDASYRSAERDILFSGDLTSAPKPNGASELFYVKNVRDSKMMMLNFFNYYEGLSTEYKLFVGEGNDNLKNNYMVDMNKMVGVLPSRLSEHQSTLGLLTEVNGNKRFYFSKTAIGRSITLKRDKTSEQLIDYFINYVQNSFDLESFLVDAGANVIHELPENGEYIDLSLHVIDKNTIIDLFQ